MNINEALEKKYINVPFSEAKCAEALKKDGATRCIVCNSDVIMIARPRQKINKGFVVHCNSCGSEVPLPVHINRKAWRVIGSYFARYKSSICEMIGPWRTKTEFSRKS